MTGSKINGTAKWIAGMVAVVALSCGAVYKHASATHQIEDNVREIVRLQACFDDLHDKVNRIDRLTVGIAAKMGVNVGDS